MNDILVAANSALRTLFAPASGQISYTKLSNSLSKTETQHAAGLMRVNHVGEVCAQALYTAQALTTSNAALRKHFLDACEEETDHLAWTEQRLQALGGRKSLLNPLWYAGAFGLGLVAGRLGDAWSLGFVVETEHQVGAHLQSHLQPYDGSADSGLPSGDTTSRDIVQQMHADELRHAENAAKEGAKDLPPPVKQLMRAAAKVMTTVAYRL
ncbi:2-polyprenyl-3-methyl-6-methoxy-1,4-benzoquinone monooxygenase [Curvibacter sp. CHRR-16]|uniref:2-polyprenyl-3-methyl-6-methoxy-1,4-benzoquinone monooxygenase n=1 Tax=Curvibacter sp. CHRR-16 TaxID=2835872 RepID=UPI001BD991B5|nr:2-polyprenyl-3-methyl-6-methoxy-1,4-benzoquinone monooxygenase [Curvibacter sp. CHRR-16]MBT0569646.1 2-polyprenyl-3-methyl-6-methoxy-1,4-benzoquinone monooxygenase [Curvibacter sp. CHRR-16]